jgi:signal transduction histidine kinase
MPDHFSRISIMGNQLRDSANISKARSKPEADYRILSIGQPTEIDLAVFDLNRLVNGMRDELRGLLREDIRFDVSGLSAERCLVKADRCQVRDLVFHLVLDAQDALPHGGSLSMVIERRRIDKADMSTPLEPTGDYVMVAVHDIPTEESAEIPERGDFRIVKGRGLSLAASYDAIKRCGGHISVSRRAGETVVRIYLPRLASPRSFQAAFGSASR